MNENRTAAPPQGTQGIKLGDILQAVFRHKWKILAISALGIVATCLLPFIMPRLYESEAKLLIKYVLEAKSARQIVGNDSQVKSVDSRGENIINTELQVLSSLDLARDVATVIGPDKVLAKAGGGTNTEAAAALIRANLLPEVPKGSSVIRIVFQHPDREMVQPILKQVIDSYLKMHTAIHLQGNEVDDFLTQETDQLHSRLTATEDALRQAKAKAGIISMDDSKKNYAEQISKIEGALLDAQAQLAERQTSAAEMAKLLHAKPVSTTNEVAVSTNVAVAPEKEIEYKRLCRLLESLRRRQDEMLGYLTPESTGVKDVQAQIEAKEKLKQQMEQQNPGLLASKVWEPASSSTPDAAAGLRSELISESSKVAALEAKIKVLTQQLDTITKAATNLNVAESSINELQRKLGLDEARYKYYFDNLEQTRIDERLGAGRVSNISRIQEASPPFRAASKLFKVMAAVLFGSIGAAFALAFAIEFYLDPSVKRAGEVEHKLGIPLFISIPLLRQNGNSHGLPPGRKVPLLAAKNDEKPGGEQESAPAHGERNGAAASLVPAGPSAPGSGDALSHPPGAMPAFSDALRDRLINFFESRNMTHKPKLVALTSCRTGSGVSTIAAGLAASLSETGDGNVLLVDMNQEEGSSYQFRRGELACGLEDALEAGKRDQAMVQDNLYVVTEGSTGDNLPRALPKRFKNLVPRLKASDFDFIIFDLPPVSQISMTPRLARFMDIVLMVIESEKTDSEMLKRGVALLHESQRNIGTVMNKQRSYVPKWLRQEL